MIEKYDEFVNRLNMIDSPKKELKKKNRLKKQKPKLEIYRIEQIKKAKSQYSAGFSNSFK